MKIIIFSNYKFLVDASTAMICLSPCLTNLQQVIKKFDPVDVKKRNLELQTTPMPSHYKIQSIHDSASNPWLGLAEAFL